MVELKEINGKYYIDFSFLDSDLHKSDVKDFCFRREEIQQSLRQLDFKVDEINEYEDLCYQTGKVEEIYEQFFNWHERVSQIRFSCSRSKTRRRILKRTVLGAVLDLARRKKTKLLKLDLEIFDPEFEAVENELIKMNEDFEEVKEESEEKIEQVNGLLNQFAQWMK